MSLNIKNERVHEMAREAARRTGMTQTSVVEEALRRLLEDYPDVGGRTEKERRLAAVKVGIARHNAERRALPEAERADFSEDDLYDPLTGLPS